MCLSSSSATNDGRRKRLDIFQSLYLSTDTSYGTHNYTCTVTPGSNNICTNFIIDSMLGLANISKPLAYTSNCFVLFWTDFLLFVHLSITWPLTAGLPSIVLPFRPCPSGELDELYLSWGNFKADVAHFILFFAQVAFLASLVILLLMGTPAIIYLGWIVMFVIVNMYLSEWFLNGPPNHLFAAGKEFAKNPGDKGEAWVSRDPSHEGEKWVFINGVAVGHHWMNSNLIRLSKTFRRPILGVHNPTFGIIFDTLECVLQRTFSYATLDIRNAYTSVSALLADDKITKLVLIAHSQGSIEAGMVLDWLYATMSTKEISKLEVFTFGNAANHWNCPINDEGPVISHMEHYANVGDWVSRFGILHFRQAKNANAVDLDPPLKSETAKNEADLPQTPVLPGDRVQKKSTSEVEAKIWSTNRFMGRLFKRTDASGHQMNQHYLGNMFVMDKDLTRVLDDEHAQDINAGFTNGAEPRAFGFMDMEIDDAMLDEDNTVLPLSGQERRQAVQTEVRITGNGSEPEVPSKVKDHSRLWQYRNGRTPKDWKHHGKKT